MDPIAQERPIAVVPVFTLPLLARKPRYPSIGKLRPLNSLNALRLSSWVNVPFAIHHLQFHRHTPSGRL